MARQTHKVTREAIFAAADEIEEQQGRVTLEAIRQKVGGSFTTLSPALHEWRARQAKTTAAPAGKDLPESLRQQLEAVGATLWTTVQSQAKARLESERKDLQRERRTMEAAQAEVAETADRLASQADDLRMQCAAFEREIRDLRTQLAEAREAEAQAEAQASAQQQLADELRQQLAATRQSLCADLVARVEALESARADSP